MGRRKSFIDKKRATTFYLVHKELDDGSDDADSGDRELVTSDDFARRRAEITEAAGQKHPLSFLFVQEEDLVQSDEQRHEILELGLADDGYNYLKHIRAAGPATSRLAAAPEGDRPATIPEESELQLAEPDEHAALGKEDAAFQPPTEDIAYVDARGLTLQDVEDDEVAAEEHSADVSAFSRPVRHTEKLQRHTAVREVDALLREVEQLDDVRRLQDGAAPAAVLGEGTLLDDFVATATRGMDLPSTRDTAPDELCSTGRGFEGVGSLGSLPEDPEEWDFESAVDSDDSDELATTFRRPEDQQQQRGPASIADSFWRPEREDRTYAQTVLDERLIQQMDVEYNDDEIGSLEDEEEATRGCGFHDGDARMQHAIEDFLANYKNGHQVAELPIHWNSKDLTSEQMATLDDELVARIKAREAYERQVATEAAEAPEADDRAVRMQFASIPQERWDCESVLSLRSDAVHQPGCIQDSARSRRNDASRDTVVLSGKTGLPLGVAGISAPRMADATAGEGGGSAANLGVAREKNEAAADKKARKAAVKEAKRAAREAKKDLKAIYTQERSRAQRHAATNKTANASVVCM